MAIKDNEQADGGAFVRPTPDYKSDPNVQARQRAGKRAAKSKGYEEVVATEEAPAEGGIVAEAEKELEAVQAEPAESDQSPKSEVVGEVEGGEVEGEMEGPVEVEPQAESEAGEPEPEIEGEVEGQGEVEPKAEMPAPEAPQAPVGEYQAPEGKTHSDLVDEYHEALAFGDIEQARVLYKQLQEHRYSENMHRAKSDAQAQAEAQAYVACVNDLVTAHPELGEDGLQADKVLALSDVYRNTGLSAVEAITKAVADLYPAAPVQEETQVLPEEPVEPATATEAAVEEPAKTEEPETDSLLPDMTERNLNKRSIPAMPSASARNEPAPEAPKPTRTSAIQIMKAKRGQA